MRQAGRASVYTPSKEVQILRERARVYTPLSSFSFQEQEELRIKYHNQ